VVGGGACVSRESERGARGVSGAWCPRSSKKACLKLFSSLPHPSLSAGNGSLTLVISRSSHLCGIAHRPHVISPSISAPSNDVAVWAARRPPSRCCSPEPAAAAHPSRASVRPCVSAVCAPSLSPGPHDAPAAAAVRARAHADAATTRDRDRDRARRLYISSLSADSSSSSSSTSSSSSSGSSSATSSSGASSASAATPSDPVTIRPTRSPKSCASSGVSV